MYVKIMRPVEGEDIVAVGLYECGAAIWSTSKNPDGSLTVHLFEDASCRHHLADVIVNLEDEAYSINGTGDTITRIRYEYKAEAPAR